MSQQVEQAPAGMAEHGDEYVRRRSRRGRSRGEESAARRFIREHGFSLLWGGAILLAAFLLLGPLAARSTPGQAAASAGATGGPTGNTDLLSIWLNRTLDSAAGAVHSVTARARGATGLFWASTNSAVKLGWLLLVAAVVVIPFRARWWLMNKSPALIIRCPRCGGTVHRVHRHRIDRVINRFVPVRRYCCSACHWRGLRVDGRASVVPARTSSRRVS